MKITRAPFDPLAIATLLAALVLAVLAAVFATGCTHVPRGGASEAHVSFGVPSVFSVKQDLAGVKATDKTVRADSASTEVQIFLFVWKSSAKDIVLSNPPPEKP